MNILNMLVDMAEIQGNVYHIKYLCFHHLHTEGQNLPSLLSCFKLKASFSGMVILSVCFLSLYSSGIRTVVALFYFLIYTIVPNGHSISFPDFTHLISLNEGFVGNFPGRSVYTARYACIITLTLILDISIICIISGLRNVIKRLRRASGKAEIQRCN